MRDLIVGDKVKFVHQLSSGTWVLVKGTLSHLDLHKTKKWCVKSLRFCSVGCVNVMVVSNLPSELFLAPWELVLLVQEVVINRVTTIEQTTLALGVSNAD